MAGAPMGGGASIASRDVVVSRPRLSVPAGACDCHLHVFGPAERYPYTTERNYTPASALPQDAVRMLDRLGLDRAVLVQPTPYGTDNRRLVAALSELGREARGIASVSADAAVGELRRLDRAGVRGIRIHSRVDGIAGLLDKMRVLAKPMTDLGWHFDLHVGADDLPALAGLAPPYATLVFDHFAGVSTPEPGAMKPLLRLLEGGRCWVKLSAPYRLPSEVASYQDLAPLIGALVLASPERLLWGSDWPHTPRHAVPGEDLSAIRPFRNFDAASLLDGLLDVIDRAAGKRILVDNPADLYGFG